jgi:hypothetical protein
LLNDIIGEKNEGSGADRRREGERKRGKLIELSWFDEIALYIHHSKFFLFL